MDTDRIHEALLREFSAGEMEKWRPALRMAVEALYSLQQNDITISIHLQYYFTVSIADIRVGVRMENTDADPRPATQRVHPDRIEDRKSVV